MQAGWSGRACAQPPPYLALGLVKAVLHKEFLSKLPHILVCLQCFLTDLISIEPLETLSGLSHRARQPRLCL